MGYGRRTRCRTILKVLYILLRLLLLYISSTRIKPMLHLYRHQPIDLHWFLYEYKIRHIWIKGLVLQNIC